MSIEAAIYELLTNDATLADLVAGDIYPDFVPAGTNMPAVTYKLVAGHDEVSTDIDVLPEDRWQITAWADTHEDCLDVFAALKDLWSRLSGTYAGVQIMETYIVQRGDVPKLSGGGAMAIYWGKFLDVMITYLE